MLLYAVKTLYLKGFIHYMLILCYYDEVVKSDKLSDKKVTKRISNNFEILFCLNVYFSRYIMKSIRGGIDYVVIWTKCKHT